MVVITEPGYVAPSTLLSPAFQQMVQAPINWQQLGQQYNFTPVSEEETARQVLQNYAGWSASQGSPTAPVVQAGLVKSAAFNPFLTIAGITLAGAAAQTGAQMLAGTASPAPVEFQEIAATSVGAAGAITTVQQVIAYLQANYPGITTTVINWVKANWKWLAIAVGAAAAIALIIRWIQGGRKPTRAEVGARGKARRYSIGANPRMGTLIKVGKRVDKITHRFVQRARHAGLIKVPGRTHYVRYHHYRRAH